MQTNCLRSQLSCDIWCFIGRYGSSDLCLNHLMFLSSLYVQLVRSTTFSVPRLWLATIITRLFNLLAAAGRRSWASRFPPNEANLELWALIDLGLFKADATTLQLVCNTALSHLKKVLNFEEQEEEDREGNETEDSSISTLTSSIWILGQMPDEDFLMVGPDLTLLVLDLWQKLSHNEFVAGPAVGLADVLSGLGQLTSRLVVGHMNRPQLYQLLVSLRVVVGNALNVGPENTFMVQTALDIISASASLSWIASVDVSFYFIPTEPVSEFLYNVIPTGKQENEIPVLQCISSPSGRSYKVKSYI